MTWLLHFLDVGFIEYIWKVLSKQVWSIQILSEGTFRSLVEFIPQWVSAVLGKIGSLLTFPTCYLEALLPDLSFFWVLKSWHLFRTKKVIQYYSMQFLVFLLFYVSLGVFKTSVIYLWELRENSVVNLKAWSLHIRDKSLMELILRIIATVKLEDLQQRFWRF